jgi:PAS domain S-box-containing protein
LASVISDGAIHPISASDFVDVAAYRYIIIIAVFAVAFFALLVICLKNISLRKELERLVELRTHALEMKASTLSTIFSVIPDLMFCKDKYGRYTQCNKSFEQYVDMSESDIRLRTDWEIFGEEHELCRAYKAIDEAIMRDGVPKTVEEEIYSARLGKRRLFETIKIPLVQRGDIAGVVGISRDITDRKALEEAALVASKAKSDFLSRVSHEIRTPLNAIIGMTHIVRNNLSDTKKALESINEISVASSHLLGIVNDVLDMAKIESGKFEISPGPFFLGTALSEVVSIMSQKCNEKHIAFETNLNELPNVCLIGDKMRLNQVLINILGNSVKFTGTEGRINFMVNVVYDDPEGMRLGFVLSDNGIGMSEEQRSKLFAPFEQTDRSIAGRFGGTGLGLAISQNLVNMMGGVINVTSGVGAGSTFSFELYFQKGEEAPEEDTYSECCCLDLSGRRILLAEDIDINRLILQEFLADTGVAIDEATNGQEALTAFEASSPGFYDLIFMDIQMPIMDGYEATKHIRALQRPDAQIIPIIAMTANAYQEDIHAAFMAGMNGHISKPIKPEIVMKTLSELLMAVL